MRIDLNRLNVTDEIIIDEEITFPKEIYQNSGIKELRDIKYKGKLYYSTVDELLMSGVLIGNMILEDTITLEDINVALNIEIQEVISENQELFKSNEENTLDIIEILWQNIVLEVPIRITNADVKEVVYGNGWCLRNESEKKIDPRLAQLQELLDEGKE